MPSSRNVHPEYKLTMTKSGSCAEDQAERESLTTSLEADRKENNGEEVQVRGAGRGGIYTNSE